MAALTRSLAARRLAGSLASQRPCRSACVSCFACRSVALRPTSSRVTGCLFGVGGVSGSGPCAEGEPAPHLWSPRPSGLRTGLRPRACSGLRAVGADAPPSRAPRAAWGSPRWNSATAASTAHTSERLSSLTKRSWTRPTNSSRSSSRTARRSSPRSRVSVPRARRGQRPPPPSREEGAPAGSFLPLPPPRGGALGDRV